MSRGASYYRAHEVGNEEADHLSPDRIGLHGLA